MEVHIQLEINWKLLTKIVDKIVRFHIIKKAEQIFLMAANQIADMYITAGSATDIYYILRKHLKCNSSVP